MALGVEGVRIGCWSSPEGPSGCTVVLAPPGTLGAVAVRGGAPGTREAVALGPAGKLTVCHAVVLSGGSAYGLAVADGVMRWLEEQGIGYETRAALVPIVGAAIVLDQGVAVPAARPGHEAGRAACEAASEDDPVEGSVGAGTGCAVAKVAGIEYSWRGGQGIAVRRSQQVTVGAIVVNNAVGEVIDEDGSWIARSRAPQSTPRFPYVVEASEDAGAAEELPEGAPGGGGSVPGGRGEEVVGPAQNTVIGCVVTNARLTKIEAFRVADLAHSGVARSIRPAHTSVDGDAMFCLAAGRIDANVDLIAMLAAEAVAEATRRAVLAANTRDGLPGLATEGRRAGGT